MKTKAAILWEPHTEYVIDEIELDGPKDGEVFVEFKACGMCHSDEHLVTGDMALPPEVTEMLGWQQYPIICGHEGAGIVQELGPNVTTLAVGDHVVTSFVPSCGKCPSCVAGHSNLCDLGAMLLAGTQLDGTFRHHTNDGKDLALMCCLGAFAHQTRACTWPGHHGFCHARNCGHGLFHDGCVFGRTQHFDVWPRINGEVGGNALAS